MKLDRRSTIVLILTGLLIGALVTAFALTGLPASAAPAASARSTDACAGDYVAGEAESEAGDAGEAEGADCPGDHDNDALEVEDGSASEDSDATGSEGAAPADTGITAEEARAIVAAAYPGTSVKEIELEQDGTFEAELSNGAEVRVDAITGSLLSLETEDGG